MFVAGGLMWANLRGEFLPTISDWGVDVYVYGWPAKVHWLVTEKSSKFWREQDIRNAFVNAFIAVAILGIVMLSLEKLIDRRRRTDS